MNQMSGPDRVLVLTLAKHRDGEWIVKLMQALADLGAEAVLQDADSIGGDIIPIDTLIPWTAICNRVSDRCAAAASCCNRHPAAAATTAPLHSERPLCELKRLNRRG